ncbi:MAG: caspase family protein [Planctomycetia bacterium]|nr:caspase family protein [Planctomycetia bacterium]
MLVFSIGIVPALHAAEDTAWQPEKTWAVVVGVLEWKQAGLLHEFPKSGRRDAQLVDMLKRRGVASDRIVFLEDRHATRERIFATLSEVLPRTNPGDTFLFYYAGHGLRSNDNQKTYLANYDITAETARTGLAVATVVDTIEREFRGSQVLLAADCCHSGALGVEAAKRHGRTSYAALTSVHPNGTSTGNWTFTECLLRGMAGDALADLNADGVVMLEELARYTEEELAFAEGQLASFVPGKGFNPKLALSKVEHPHAAGVGRRMEAEWRGSWWPVHTQAVENGKTKIHYAGFGAEWDEWVGPERLRDYHPQTIPKGTSVQVLWQGKWWPAKVKGSRLGLQFIEYNGFGHEWDEWVGRKRIRQ